ncbi:MAG: hypothetical protein HC800_04290 [Phormidesmis sp. RL_2_1]|nr:hypothetical protein [Phormidesmis sp. RL_2_1]
MTFQQFSQNQVWPPSKRPRPTNSPQSASNFAWADGWVLLIFWLLSAAFIITWVSLDKAPPAWDQGDHLSRAMSHWQTLQHAQWFSGDWWRELWMQAPTQRAPLTYLMTALVFNILGTGFDQAIYTNLVFTAILLGSTYGIGRRIFSPAVGRWAAGLSLLSPVLIDLQKDYLLDYPMTAMVAFMFVGMTYFWLATNPWSRWLTLVLWGVGLGLMLMTRTSGLLFAIPPVAWMLGASLFQRQWLRFGQVGVGLVISVLTLWPWFSTNWLTVISTTVASTSHGVLYRNDPQANTLAGWLFYIIQQPQLLSWALLGLAAIAWILVTFQTLLNHRPSLNSLPSQSTAIILAPQPGPNLGAVAKAGYGYVFSSSAPICYLHWVHTKHLGCMFLTFRWLGCYWPKPSSPSKIAGGSACGGAQSASPCG